MPEIITRNIEKILMKLFILLGDIWKLLKKQKFHSLFKKLPEIL